MSLLTAVSAGAQNVSARTNEFEVDFSDPSKLVHTTIPVISWVAPQQETSYAQDMKFRIKIEVQSDKPIRNVTIYIKEAEGASRGMTTIAPEVGHERKMTVEKTLTLLQGDNILEVVAENIDGQKTISQREVHIGRSRDDHRLRPATESATATPAAKTTPVNASFPANPFP